MGGWSRATAAEHGDMGRVEGLEIAGVSGFLERKLGIISWSLAASIVNTAP